MLYEEELRKYLTRKNVFPIRYVSKTCKEIIVLDVSQDDFMKFLKLKEASIVYYNYKYYDKQDYLITETDNVEEFAKYKAEIEAYNSKVEALEFDKPYQLSLMFIADSIAYVVEYLDEWIEEIDDIMQGDVALDSITNLYSASDKKEVMKKYLTNKENKRKHNLINAKELLYEFLVSDPKFKVCTNQKLRQKYAVDLKSYNPDIAKMFIDENGYYLIQDIDYVVEIAYKAIKSGDTGLEEVSKLI